MRDKIKDFLDDVCSHVRAKAAHKEIRTELVGHIEEMQNNGMTVDAAISSMGDCAEIGAKLDKQHRPQIEWSLIGLVVFIVAIGMAMMSGDNVPSFINTDNHFFMSAIGIGIAIGIMFFDYTKLKKWALPLYIIGLIFLLFGFIRNINISGAIHIQIGFLIISPKLVIIPFILAFVGFIDRFRGEGIWGIVKLLILGAISVFMMTLVPNTAFALITLVCYAVLLFTAVAKNHFGGSNKAQILILCGLALAIILFVVITIINIAINSPWVLNRFLGFINNTDPYGMGFQNTMLSIVLSQAQLWGGGGLISGAGITGEIAAYYVLPGIISEFALANVIVTFGWIVGIALILAIVVLIARLFMITRKIRNDFGFYIAVSAYVVLTMQFLINVLMNFGLFPIMAVGLPFVSFGGSLYVANMVLVGIILSVWRRNNILRVSQKQAGNAKMPLFEYADGKLIVNLKGK